MSADQPGVTDEAHHKPGDRVVIRRADAGDLPALELLEADAFGSLGYNWVAFRQLLDLSAPFFFVAETDRVLGYIVGARSHDPAMAWLLSVGVRPEARGRGIATQLAETVIDALLAVGVTELRGTVAPENEASRRIWRRLGFTEERVEPDYFGDRNDRIILSWVRRDGS